MLRLFLLSPAVVFAARVNQASFTYPLDEVTYDTVTTGAFASIQAGMTVVFGTTAGGTDLGRQRIRTVADATKLYIGRSSEGNGDGEVDLADNVYITVWNDYRLWAKIPYIAPDGTIYKDSRIVLADRTTEPPPVSNTGPPFAATIDAITGLVTVEFDGSASFPVASGATITTYAWNIADGTVTVGTTAGAALTVTFPAGFRWVSLSITDSNGKSHVARTFVYARNPAADASIVAFQIESHRIAPEGQQLSVRVRANIPAATYPNGTLVVLIDGEPADAADRTNVLFWGWHQETPATIAAQREGLLRDVVLNCLDVGQKLDTLPGFPQTIERKDNPETWTEMAGANMDRYHHYLLHWHSTVLELADWRWSGTGDTYTFLILGSEGESLFDQVNRRAQSMVPDHLFVCNRRGQLAIVVDPMQQDEGARTSTVQAALTESDWSDLRYSERRPPNIHWLRGSAIDTDTSEIVALFCIAPGEAPGQGEQAEDHGEQLSPNQAALNNCTGHRYARRNARQSTFEVTLVTGDDRDIEPAALTWVTLTVSAATSAQRGLSFIEARGLPKDLNIIYNHEREALLRTVRFTWERESIGIPAVTVIPPESSSPPAPDLPPGYWDVPPPVVDPDVGDGLHTVYVMSQTLLIRTRNFGAATPNWVSIGPGSTEYVDFILDPWAPATTGYLGTEAGLYKSTNLDTVTPTWTLILSVATIDADLLIDYSHAIHQGSSKLMASVNVEGLILWSIPASTTGRLFVIHSEDGGATWNAYWQVTRTIGANITAGGAIDLYQSRILTGFDDAPLMILADGDRNTIYKSLSVQATGPHWDNVLGEPDTPWTTTNQGHEFPALLGADTTGAQLVHFPYNDNPDGLHYFVGGEQRVYKINGYIPVVGQVEVNVGHGCYGKRTLESYTQDRQLMWMFEYVVAPSTPSPVWTSDDAGDTWSAATATGILERIIAASGWPYSPDYIYALSTKRIYFSTDRGATFADKTGDWTAQPDFNYNGNVRGAVIIPLWVAE